MASNFCDVMFFLSSCHFLVLELWQFLFVRDWQEIPKSNIHPPEFCPISGGREESGIPNLARMSSIERIYMLQNARFTAFTVFEFLPSPLPPPLSSPLPSPPPSPLLPPLPSPSPLPFPPPPPLSSPSPPTPYHTTHTHARTQRLGLSTYYG